MGSIYHAAASGYYSTVSIVPGAESIFPDTASIVYSTASIVTGTVSIDYDAAFCHYGSVSIHSFIVFVLPAFVTGHSFPAPDCYGFVSVDYGAVFCLNGIVSFYPFTAFNDTAAVPVDYLIVTGHNGDVIVLYANVTGAESQRGTNPPNGGVSLNNV